jgi:hypothetical protein
MLSVEHPELPQAAAERDAADPQFFRGPGLIAAEMPHHFLQDDAVGE